MNEELDLQVIRDRLIESPMNAGCNAVGVCNEDVLEGGPAVEKQARWQGKLRIHWRVGTSGMTWSTGWAEV